MGVGGSDITNKLIQNATSKISSGAGKMLVQLGIQATGEATEEFLSYAGNYLSDNLIINNLGSTDFSSEWDWKDVGEQMALAFVSSAITAGGGNMVNNNIAIQSAEEQLGRKLNKTEKAEVTQAIINAAVEEKKAIKFDPEGMGENVGTFYATTINQNGEIDNIIETTGKIIENPNKKVNVSPVIVRNNENNTYNIIDGNTGALLDSSEYETLIEAKAEFSSKMINLDENSIQEINNAVTERNIALQDKAKETAIELSNILTSQNAQETNSDNLTSNTTNNISQEINSNTSQNDSNFYNSATKYVVNGAEEFINRFNDKKTYTEEQISNIVDEEYDNIVSHDDQGNVESYIDFETEGNTLQISLKDGNTDEIIKATGIEANKNGRYSAEQVRNAIRDIATIENENRPIKGQQDIEGNEVRSMKKDKKVSNKSNANQTMTDNDIRNIVKYNPDGREIHDQEYIDFLVERFKDNKNISDVETETKSIIDLLEKNYQKAKQLILDNDEKKIRNKQKDLTISNLLKKIKEKTFKVNLKFKNENGQNINTLLDIEISKSGLKESFNKSVSNEKYAVVPYLDELIKTAQNGIIRSEAKARDNINEWYYLYNTAIVDGQLYGVKIDIKKTTQGDKFYVHRLNIIKEGLSSTESIVEDNTIGNTETPSINTSIAQNNNNVNKSSINTKSMQNNKVNTIYRRFTKEFKNKGYIDLNDKTVNNIEEVADIAQIFRNPNYETFRIIYVKENAIVGQEAISSKIPGFSTTLHSLNKAKNFYNMKDRMARLHADGYYLIHNHPSGKAKSSSVDISATANFIKNVDGFKGHIIVNSRTYATLTLNENNEIVDKNYIELSNYSENEIESLIGDSPLNNIKINSTLELAKLAHNIKNSPNYSMLVLTDAALKIRTILDVPNKYFNNKEINNYIKNVAKTMRF